MRGLLNPYRFGGIVALSGYASPTVFKSGTEAQTYGGSGVWDYPVVAGELIAVSMHGLGNGTLINPTNFTLSLGGNAMTRVTASATATVNNHPGSAHFRLVAGSTGTLALAADVGVSARACVLVARRITGFDTGTPQPHGGAPSILNTDATTMSGAGFTTGRANNVVIGDWCTKGATSTNATSGVFDGMAFDKTGNTTVTDLAVGFGYKLVASPSSFTPQIAFDVAGRMSGSFIEINVAP